MPCLPNLLMETCMSKGKDPLEELRQPMTRPRVREAWWVHIFAFNYGFLIEFYSYTGFIEHEI